MIHVGNTMTSQGNRKLGLKVLTDTVSWSDHENEIRCFHHTHTHSV